MWRELGLRDIRLRGNSGLWYLLDKKCGVNGTCLGGHTLLYYACRLGMAKVVAMLLKISGVDVNAPSKEGTPLWTACNFLNFECVRWLLEDARTDVMTEVPNYICAQAQTALEIAVATDSVECVKWFLALRRPSEIIVRGKFVELGVCPNTASLLGHFSLDPVGLRQRLCLELDVRTAANLFSAILLLSDEFFLIKRAHTAVVLEAQGAQGAARFFTMAIGLPMELQMVLALRALSSGRHVILRQEFNPAIDWWLAAE